MTTDFGGFDEAQGVAVLPDGKIVAAGRASVDFAVARYNRDGSLDDSFGGDGKVTTDFGIPGGDVAFGVAPRADGKIVAAGDASGDFGVARYNRDGSLDQTFGGDGTVRTGFSGGDWAHGVALQPDGKIVAAGWSTTADVVFALVRYNRDGSLDDSFGSDGRVTTDFGGHEVAHGVAVQPDGKIVAAGVPFDSASGSTSLSPATTATARSTGASAAMAVTDGRSWPKRKGIVPMML